MPEAPTSLGLSDQLDSAASSSVEKRNRDSLSPTSEDEAFSKLSRTEPAILLRVQSMLDKLLSDVNDKLNGIDDKLDRHFNELNTRLDSFETRVAQVEQADASRQLTVVNLSIDVETLLAKQELLETKILSLENRSVDPAAAPPPPSWQPSGPTNTNILLLGDSNSGGKLKFGRGKGTLGEALPGVNEYIVKVGQLPPPDSAAFTDKTDVVIAVGTNDLKEADCNPDILIQQLHVYITSLKRLHPATHVHLPGVLPICATDSNTNVKIRTYNHYLADMAETIPRVTFIDTKVLRSREGSLLSKFACGPTDPLHLNGQGLRLYFSRIKYSLRLRHNLPVNFRRTPAEAHNNQDRGDAPMREHQGIRGGHQSRGGNRGRGDRGRGR